MIKRSYLIVAVVTFVAGIAVILYMRSRAQGEAPVDVRGETGKVNMPGHSEERSPRLWAKARAETVRDRESVEDEEPSAATSDDVLRNLAGGDRHRALEAAASVVRDPSERGVELLLVAVSRASDQELRKQLLQQLRQVDPSVAPDLLVRRIGIRKDGDIQRVLFESLAGDGGPRVVAALISWAEANLEDEYLSRAVGRIINEVDNPESVEGLAKGLASDNFPVSCGSAAALAAIGTPQAVRTLTVRFGISETDDEVLIEALSRVNNPAALPALLDAAQNAASGTEAAKGISKALANYPSTAEIRDVQQQLSPDA